MAPWWVPGAGPPGRGPGPYIYGAIDRERGVGRRLAPQIHVSVQDPTPATPPPPASSATAPRWHGRGPRPGSSRAGTAFAPSRRPAATRRWPGAWFARIPVRRWRPTQGLCPSGHGNRHREDPAVRTGSGPTQGPCPSDHGSRHPGGPDRLGPDAGALPIGPQEPPSGRPGGPDRLGADASGDRSGVCHRAGALGHRGAVADEAGGGGVAGVGSWTLTCICGANLRPTPRSRSMAP